MLTAKEIHLILERLGRKVVVSPIEDFGYEISCPAMGYQPGAIGKLQAKLSIMLQVAAEKEQA